MIDIVALVALVAIVVLAYRTNSLRLRIIVLTALLIVYLGRELTAMYIAHYSIPPGTVEKLFYAYVSTGAKDVAWGNIPYVVYELVLMIGLYTLCVWGFVREDRQHRAINA